jgi:hypothetical protein
MIINNAYFVGDIYIPQAKPSITDEVVDSGNHFPVLRDKLVDECLFKCLGERLYELLIAELDITRANGLKEASDTKWDRLLNGHKYTPSGGDSNITWRGIRYKTANIYNQSFLAYYVYFFHERKRYLDMANVASASEKPVNDDMYASISNRAVEAWNNFVTLVQGKGTTRELVYHDKTGYVGYDYYQGNDRVTLYKFIKDMNDISEDYYPGFNGQKWELMNKFGI